MSLRISSFFLFLGLLVAAPAVEAKNYELASPSRSQQAQKKAAKKKSFFTKKDIYIFGAGAAVAAIAIFVLAKKKQECSGCKKLSHFFSGFFDRISWDTLSNDDDRDEWSAGRVIGERYHEITFDKENGMVYEERAASGGDENYECLSGISNPS